MIIPCKSFKFPTKDKPKYFKHHYKRCTKCDITNNNNIELMTLLDKATIEVVEVRTQNSKFYNSVLDCYLSLRKYEPVETPDYPFIRITYINNGDELYNHCLLVSWINN